MTVTERTAFAAACLRGVPFRPIEREDVGFWQANQWLLPIANVLASRNAINHIAVDGLGETIASARRVAAVAEAAERRVLGELLTVLGAAGVDALLLKGVALGYTVYPEPWLRARSDIDVLVRAGAMNRVAEALSGIGFQGAREVSHPLITRQRHFTRTRGFRVAIDVHEALVNPPVLRTLPGFDELYARAQWVGRLPIPAKALATPDALLHALVHRVAHHNSSVDLLWLYDMHLLVGHMSAPDWTTLLDTARRSHVCRIAWDGLVLLQRMLGSDIPADTLPRLDAVRNEPSAALLGGELTEWRLQWINLRSLPGFGARLDFVRAHLAPPPQDLALDDQRSWRVPSRYVGRALRGARKWRRPISKTRL